jgi:diguanylate cyclase (GGDEF)-like protein
MGILRPDQCEVVIATAAGEAPSQIEGVLAEADFVCSTVEIGLEGLGKVAKIKPVAIVAVGLDKSMLDWLLNFVDGNPDAPVVVAVAEPEALIGAPGWLYDVVAPGEVASALVHRLSRALTYDDMRRLSAQRAEKLGLSGAQLRMVSMIDVVTGLFNRRYFRKHLRESYAGARRYERPLTLLLMRIESYRELLHARGTEGTNDILDSIALAISTVIREADIAARLDEDVFGFLLPETTQEGASSLVKRLMARFNTAKLPHDVDVTMVHSFAQLEPEHQDGGALLDAALAKLPPRTGLVKDAE